MNNTFYDICFSILLKANNIPEVASTVKDIRTGFDYECNYPKTATEFFIRKSEIVSYIQRVRGNNIIDKFKNEAGILAYIPSSAGKLLTELLPDELYNNLDVEIKRLIIKGMYQLIKFYYPTNDDRNIMQDLFLRDIKALSKYGIVNNSCGA